LSWNLMNLQPLQNRDLESGERPDGISILEDTGVTQQVSRTVQDGWDTVMGYYRCPFEPGQRRSIVHVAFQPAMPSTPEVETMVLDADDARIRLTDSKVYGLRIEVVLSQPAASNTSVLIEVIATCPARVGSQ
ncbi:MAG: hypothetical protein VYE64_01995, partial [Planctomycetota bacterium]|nr:hypothetical protein [Planctomycetota bacterium]